LTFVAYANTGPFTNNVQPPSLSATLFNNIESFLDQIVSSAVADANITANGSGALTAVSETLTGAGTGLTVSHNATVSGILTTTGNHVANGGMNINTIRDNGGGNTAMDLSAGSGLVKFPHGITLTGAALNLLSGSITRIWISGQLSIAVAGTSVSHGLGVTPDFVIGTLDVGAGTTNAVGINYGTMTSSNFTAYTSAGTQNCRFIAIKQ